MFTNYMDKLESLQSFVEELHHVGGQKPDRDASEALLQARAACVRALKDLRKETGDVPKQEEGVLSLGEEEALDVVVAAILTAESSSEPSDAVRIACGRHRTEIRAEARIEAWRLIDGVVGQTWDSRSKVEIDYLWALATLDGADQVGSIFGEAICGLLYNVVAPLGTVGAGLRWETEEAEAVEELEELSCSDRLVVLVDLWGVYGVRLGSRILPRLQERIRDTSSLWKSALDRSAQGVSSVLGIATSMTRESSQSAASELVRVLNGRVEASRNKLHQAGLSSTPWLMAGIAGSEWGRAILQQLRVRKVRVDTEDAETVLAGLTLCGSCVEDTDDVVGVWTRRSLRTEKSIADDALSSVVSELVIPWMESWTETVWPSERMATKKPWSRVAVASENASRAVGRANAALFVARFAPPSIRSELIRRCEVAVDRLAQRTAHAWHTIYTRSSLSDANAALAADTEAADVGLQMSAGSTQVPLAESHRFRNDLAFHTVKHISTAILDLVLEEDKSMFRNIAPHIPQILAQAAGPTVEPKSALPSHAARRALDVAKIYTLPPPSKESLLKSLQGLLDSDPSDDHPAFHEASDMLASKSICYLPPNQALRLLQIQLE